MTKWTCLVKDPHAEGSYISNGREVYPLNPVGTFDRILHDRGWFGAWYDISTWEYDCSYSLPREFFE